MIPSISLSLSLHPYAFIWNIGEWLPSSNGYFPQVYMAINFKVKSILLDRHVLPFLSENYNVFTYVSRWSFWNLTFNILRCHLLLNNQGSHEFYLWKHSWLLWFADGRQGPSSSPGPYGYNFVILTFKCCFFHFYWLPVVQQHAEWPHLKDRVGNERAIGQLKIEEMMENDYCGET